MWRGGEGGWNGVACEVSQGEGRSVVVVVVVGLRSGCVVGVQGWCGRVLGSWG